MNGIMRRITAVFLALCCVPVTVLSAGATDFSWQTGTTSWKGVDHLEKVDLQKYGLSGSVEYYVDSSKNYFITLSPRKNTMRFVMRNADDEKDMDELADTVYDIVKEFVPAVQYNCIIDINATVPQLSKASTCTMGRCNAFELFMPENTGNMKEIESGILLALARKHLISEFYGWGETASFQNLIYFDGDLQYDIMDAEYYEDRNVQIVTREGVENYLTAHYPEYTLECINNDFHIYVIKGSAELPDLERLELIYELWQQLGLEYQFIVEPSISATVFGHNALEYRGDVTLDCELSIVDVIALNRNLLSNDPLCNTAKTNADVNGDGTPDEKDSLAILKEIVGLINNYIE